MYTGISAACFICTILVYVCHHKNDDTDVEDDAIGRSGSQADQYNKNNAVVEYEVEKGAL
jgi:POT family proton-dependent oligopeptide transporter